MKKILMTLAILGGAIAPLSAGHAQNIRDAYIETVRDWSVIGGRTGRDTVNCGISRMISDRYFEYVTAVNRSPFQIMQAFTMETSLPTARAARLAFSIDGGEIKTLTDAIRNVDDTRMITVLLPQRDWTPTMRAMGTGQTLRVTVTVDGRPPEVTTIPLQGMAEAIEARQECMTETMRRAGMMR